MRLRSGSLPFLVGLGVLLAPGVVRGQAPASPDTPTQPQPGVADARELANQVSNPAAPLTLLQFRDILLPSVQGTHGATNVFQIQPVLPMGPFAALPFIQLMKVTMPFGSLPSPSGAAGTGDLQVFDLISIKQSWGRWGFGPALVFPTASGRALGEGKWQAGPAFALIYTGVKNLSVGAVWQNPMSYAGASDRPDVNNLIITPTLTYTLEKGWFAGLSDYDLTFDWKDGGAATVPLGVQVGRVFEIGDQSVSLSFEVGGAAAKPSTAPGPGWILGFEFTPIFKGRLK